MKLIDVINMAPEELGSAIQGLIEEARSSGDLESERERAIITLGAGLLLRTVMALETIADSAQQFTTDHASVNSLRNT